MKWKGTGCWLRESEGFHEIELKSIPAVSGSFIFFCNGAECLVRMDVIIQWSGWESSFILGDHG